MGRTQSSTGLRRVDDSYPCSCHRWIGLLFDRGDFPDSAADAVHGPATAGRGFILPFRRTWATVNKIATRRSFSGKATLEFPGEVAARGGVSCPKARAFSGSRRNAGGTGSFRPRPSGPSADRAPSIASRGLMPSGSRPAAPPRPRWDRTSRSGSAPRRRTAAGRPDRRGAPAFASPAAPAPRGRGRPRRGGTPASLATCTP